MGGGSDVQAPQPSAAEIELQQAQASLLNFSRSQLEEQSRESERLRGVQLAQAGLEPVYEDVQVPIPATSGSSDANALRQLLANTDPGSPLRGQIQRELAAAESGGAGGGFRTERRLTGYRETETAQRTRVSKQQTEQRLAELSGRALTEFEETQERQRPIQRLHEEVSTATLERQQKALRGEIPDSPLLLKDLAKQEETLRGALLSQLGPGFETSSPGIEALRRLGESRNLTLEEARRGDITGLSGINLANVGALEGIRAQRLQESAGLAGNVQLANVLQPFQFSNQLIGQGAQLAQGFGQAQTPFREQRMAEFEAQVRNASRPNPLGSIFGTVAGVALAPYTGGLSLAAVPGFASGIFRS